MKNISTNRFRAHNQFDGGVFDWVSENLLFFQVNLELYVSSLLFAKVNMAYLRLKKKISEETQMNGLDTSVTCCVPCTTQIDGRVAIITILVS